MGLWEDTYVGNHGRIVVYERCGEDIEKDSGVDIKHADMMCLLCRQKNIPLEPQRLLCTGKCNFRHQRVRFAMYPQQESQSSRRILPVIDSWPANDSDESLHLY